MMIIYTVMVLAMLYEVGSFVVASFAELWRIAPGLKDAADNGGTTEVRWKIHE